MLQQSGTLCIALSRLAQWPNVSRIGPWAPIGLGGTSLLWKMPAFPSFNFSSTMAQTQKMTKEALAQDVPVNDKSPKKDQGTTYPNIQSAIASAESLNELLELVDKKTISGDNLTDLISKLTHWKISGKIKDEDFQNDPRFIQAQKMLQKPTFLKHVSSREMTKSGESGTADIELRAVLKVQSITKAIDLSQTFSFRQRLAVMKNLAVSNHRPLPLLNTLAHGINKDIRKLNMKEVTDLLFSMSKLNYINIELLGNACNVLKEHLKTTSKHAVVGSAITSLRKLNFRDEGLLEDLSVWLEKNFSGFQHPTSFLYTLALQNYLPSNHKALFEMMWKNFKYGVQDYNDAVTFVWSLLVLNQVTAEQVEYILNPAFIRDLDLEPVWEPTVKKLLNLNAAAQSLLPAYKGPQLPNHMLEGRLCVESPEKKNLLSRVSDSLFRKMDQSLFATSAPTTMGFNIDLICNLDQKGTPVPLTNTSPGISRVAVMALTYRDCCVPSSAPTGIKNLEKKLLESQGFKVVTFPFHVFSSDKASKQSHMFFKAALEQILSKPC